MTPKQFSRILPQEASSIPAKSEADDGLQSVDLFAAILSTIAIRIGVDDVMPKKLVRSLNFTKKS